MALAGVMTRRLCMELISVASAKPRPVLTHPLPFRYLTDSLVNRIYAYDYKDGELSNKRLLIDALSLGLPERTYPDGLCIDDGASWAN